MRQGYTGPEVCKITGISYRQLDHWTTTKLIEASIRNIKGSGFHRIYSFQDIDLLRKGQAVFGISLGPVHTETEAEIFSLYPEKISAINE